MADQTERFIQILERDGHLTALDEKGDVYVWRAGEVVQSFVTGSARATWGWHQLSPERIPYADWKAAQDALRDADEAAVREEQRQRRTTSGDGEVRSAPR